MLSYSSSGNILFSILGRFLSFRKRQNLRENTSLCRIGTPLFYPLSRKRALRNDHTPLSAKIQERAFSVFDVSSLSRYDSLRNSRTLFFRYLMCRASLDTISDTANRYVCVRRRRRRRGCCCCRLPFQVTLRNGDVVARRGCGIVLHTRAEGRDGNVWLKCRSNQDRGALVDALVPWFEANSVNGAGELNVQQVTPAGFLFFSVYAPIPFRWSLYAPVPFRWSLVVVCTDSLPLVVSMPFSFYSAAQSAVGFYLLRLSPPSECLRRGSHVRTAVDVFQVRQL